MSLIAKLLRVADAYSVASGLNLRLISDRIFADRRRFENLHAGKADLNTRSYEKAMLWFASNWPEAVAWPEGIERPEQGAETAAEPQAHGAAA